MAETAVFVARNSGFEATELARGPWDPEAQHGGAPAALLMRAFERTAFERTDRTEALALARVTYEFMRPVPLGPLSVNAALIRPGRRVQLLEGSILAPDGTEVVRARALRVAFARAAAGPPEPPPGCSGSRPQRSSRTGSRRRSPGANMCSSTRT